MKKKSDEKGQSAVFKVDGATCPSCVFAIEHITRKIPGILDVRVDVPEKHILVNYEGEPSCLDKVKKIVRQLGYNAELI